MSKRAEQVVFAEFSCLYERADFKVVDIQQFNRQSSHTTMVGGSTETTMLSSGYSRVDVTAPTAHTVIASSISQRVFLGGVDGKEMSIELPENFGVRLGHQLTLTWLTYPGLQGALEHVKNEATGGTVIVGAQTGYLWSSVNNALAEFAGSWLMFSAVLVAIQLATGKIMNVFATNASRVGIAPMLNWKGSYGLRLVAASSAL